ncbi:hypothetical protein EZS27_035842 [termite gut metagenome]|uniref:Uncharacterized protein n=1 Tax=termite gut metagenome TaxID=433724 RepID=A0A5J4PXM1_9ZZZZ
MLTILKYTLFLYSSKRKTGNDLVTEILHKPSFHCFFPVFKTMRNEEYQPYLQSITRFFLYLHYKLFSYTELTLVKIEL